MLLFCFNATAVMSAEDKVELPIPSSSAQRLYARAKADIVQLRSLLKNGRTQSSVGSGFLIGTSNLVVTNYHVMSQIALEPDVYTGEYVDTYGKRGKVELLAVDVLHDLAVVRIDRKGSGFFNVPDKLPVLSQGQYLYSLGNPLDLGFAISEGAYNGVISRSFYDQLMFTGPINAGMSGGPNVTVDGRVAGVNVSKRLDGELVSFLVPVRYVRDLLKKVAGQKQVPKDFKLVVGQQLLGAPDDDGGPAGEHAAHFQGTETVPGAGMGVGSGTVLGPVQLETEQTLYAGPGELFDGVGAVRVEPDLKPGTSRSSTSCCKAANWALCSSPCWRATTSRIRKAAATRIRATPRRSVSSNS